MQHDWWMIPVLLRRDAWRTDRQTYTFGASIVGTRKWDRRPSASLRFISAYVPQDIGAAMSGAGLCPATVRTDAVPCI